MPAFVKDEVIDDECGDLRKIGKHIGITDPTKGDAILKAVHTIGTVFRRERATREKERTLFESKKKRLVEERLEVRQEKTELHKQLELATSITNGISSRQNREDQMQLIVEQYQRHITDHQKFLDKQVALVEGQTQASHTLDQMIRKLAEHFDGKSMNEIKDAVLSLKRKADEELEAQGRRLVTAADNAQYFREAAYRDELSTARWVTCKPQVAHKVDKSYTVEDSGVVGGRQMANTREVDCVSIAHRKVALPADTQRSRTNKSGAVYKLGHFRLKPFFSSYNFLLYTIPARDRALFPSGFSPSHSRPLAFIFATTKTAKPQMETQIVNPKMSPQEMNRIKELTLSVQNRIMLELTNQSITAPEAFRKYHFWKYIGIAMDVYPQVSKVFQIQEDPRAVQTRILGPAHARRCHSVMCPSIVPDDGQLIIDLSHIKAEHFDSDVDANENDNAQSGRTRDVTMTMTRQESMEKAAIFLPRLLARGENQQALVPIVQKWVSVPAFEVLHNDHQKLVTTISATTATTALPTMATAMTMIIASEMHFGGSTPRLLGAVSVAEQIGEPKVDSFDVRSLLWLIRPVAVSLAASICGISPSVVQLITIIIFQVEK
ncbi:hypothetical protein G7046_g5618 [Stylonectria norvegica]|nr:hypothetical protein G7046_g5618 [Stylonectria norvegica]